VETQPDRADIGHPDGSTRGLAQRWVAEAMDAARGRVSEFMATFMDEPDHVAVILASSKMDDLLDQAVRARLRPNQAKVDPLSDKGVGSFYLRIHLAHRLGLIGPRLVGVLNQFRTLRNDFAHTFEAQSLEVAPHCDRVDDLLVRLAVGSEITEFRQEAESTYVGVKRHKFGFIVATAIVIAELEAILLVTEPVDDKIALMGETCEQAAPA